MWSHVFEYQERAVESILRSSEQQAAVQVAPKVLDSVQQKVAAIIQQSLNRSDVDRSDAVESLRFLSAPASKAAVKKLRDALRAYQVDQDLNALLTAVKALRADLGIRTTEASTLHRVQRSDLRLICFDFVSS